MKYTVQLSYMLRRIFDGPVLWPHPSSLPVRDPLPSLGEERQTVPKVRNAEVRNRTCSSRRTLFPCLARWYAVKQPWMPAPITMAS